MPFGGFRGRAHPRISGVAGRDIDSQVATAMTTTALGGIGGRETVSRGVLRRTMARMIATREQQARRRVFAHLLGLDDATLATYGFDRRAVEEFGRGRFPL